MPSIRKSLCKPPTSAITARSSLAFTISTKTSQPSIPQATNNREGPSMSNFPSSASSTKWETYINQTITACRALSPVGIIMDLRLLPAIHTRTHWTTWVRTGTLERDLVFPRTAHTPCENTPAALSTTYSVPGKKSFAQLLEGWQITSIVSLFGAQPWGPIDAGTDVSHTGEGVDRWNFSGNPADFKPTRSSGIPWFDGIANPFPAACLAQATTPALLASLNTFGCYAVGSSVMTPPADGTFGTMGRNTFRDFGFRNWDMSVVKNTKFGGRLSAQFRAEFFNVLNHPNFANPF